MPKVTFSGGNLQTQLNPNFPFLHQVVPTVTDDNLETSHSYES
jgi:hypothetical protein